MLRTRTLVFLILVTLCLAGSSVVYMLMHHRIPDMAYGETTIPEKSSTNTRIFFVGDVMPGRRVETLSLQYGLSYPFESATYMLAGSDVTVGNLEGSVPEQHVHTPDLTYQFSFHERVLPVLKTVGFDILSLANNHAYDYGIDGLVYTKKTCVDAALTCVGDPEVLSTTSLNYRMIHDVRVGFIMIHATTVSVDMAVLETLLAELRVQSDVQIAYVHWGEEYALEHSPAQEMLAYSLINGGVDAVIGHHPHVVQDVALYQGKPIFYSLGNFVFDQYFSDDVQEGLGVHMEIEAEAILYTLIAFESKTNRSQPRLASDSEAKKLFTRILGEPTGRTTVNIDEGIIRTPR